MTAKPNGALLSVRGLQVSFPTDRRPSRVVDGVTFQVRQGVRAGQGIVARLAGDRLGRAVRLQLDQVLLALEHQGEGRGDMAMPPAMAAARRVAQQHV